MQQKRRRDHVTIYTIAEVAGVHPSTASRALNRQSKQRISPQTAERIRQIAAELGYEPHPWARSLRTNRTLTIGVVLPRLTDGVLAKMGEFAENRARDHGFIAVTLSTHDQQEDQVLLVDLLLDRRVDGLILATPARNDPLLDDLESRNVPFVLMNRQSGQHPSISADDELGGYLATRHLLGLGHERIGIVAGPLEFSTAALRLDGYARALSEAGVPVDEGLIATSSFHMDSGVTTGTTLLSSRARPTAIFCVNDSTAIGVMAAARSLGLGIPQDVAIVGYNDTEVAAMLQPPLSSVAIPLEQMGQLAVDALIERINGGTPTSVLIRPQLTIRGSSDR